MSMGRLIQKVRKLRSMTQKQLGTAIGLNPGTASIRVAQYERGYRTPRFEQQKKIAEVLEISTSVLSSAELFCFCDSVMHSLFSLEDAGIVHIDNLNGQMCLTFDQKQSNWMETEHALHVWMEKQRELQQGKITRDEYDLWRYGFQK